MKLFRLLLIVFITGALDAKNIALCIMATGKYLSYAELFIASARRHFCPGHAVTYIIFTDGHPKPAHDVVRIYQQRLGWPFDTLKRFHAYAAQEAYLGNFDYIFASDADMLFVDTVGDEIFSERVATLHPGFLQQRGTYEMNPRSRACVSAHEGQYYFAGGFYGGSAAEFLRLVKTNVCHVNEDLAWNFIAVWHDESHLNRYFIDNPPTKILSPSYCYPERWNLPFKRKLLALDKNHDEMRK